MKIPLCLIFISILVSCQRPTDALDEKDLYQFVGDEGNNLSKKEEADGYTVTVTYKPSDLIALQQMRSKTSSEFDSLSHYYSQYLYFMLEMTYDDKDLETAYASDPGSFAEKITYLSSGMTEHIRLVTARDTTALTDYVYARSYGLGSSQCLLVFDKPKEEDFKILVNGLVLGFGQLSFPFQSSNIKKTPQLKLKL
jgi:hypothetical protein